MVHGIKVGDRVRLIAEPLWHGTVLALEQNAVMHAVVQFDANAGKGTTDVQVSQLEHYGAFLVVGCEQYGDWSYIPVNDRGYSLTIEKAALKLAEDLKRSEHRKHVHLLEIMHEDPGTSAKNQGPWVVVFLRDGFWTVTNGFSWQKHAEAHAEKHLRNAPAERKISNVTVRRLPLPAGYKKE